MPNWCTNHATITAVTDEAKQLLSDYRDFLSINGNSKFFNFFLPIPEDLNITAGSMSGKEGEELKNKEQENLEKHGYRNWYDFSVAKWGTKWDVDISQSDLDGDNIYMNEDTAWGPPIEFYRHMEELGFEVEATYSETGAGFYGSYSGGCDESNDLPSLVGVARVLYNIKSEFSTIYTLVDFDINNIKMGDILTAETGETFVYVSHDIYDSKSIMEDNPELDNETLWELEPIYGEIAEVDEVYVVNVSRDQSVPGTETCIIFSDNMNKIVFPEG